MSSSLPPLIYKFTAAVEETSNVWKIYFKTFCCPCKSIVASENLRRPVKSTRLHMNIRKKRESKEERRSSHKGGSKNCTPQKSHSQITEQKQHFTHRHTVSKQISSFGVLLRNSSALCHTHTEPLPCF